MSPGTRARLLNLADREFRSLTERPSQPPPLQRFKALKLELKTFDASWDRKRGSVVRLAGMLLVHGSGRTRRAFRMLLERDVAEIERRLALYRANCPKRIAEDMRIHINTVSKVNLGLHPVQIATQR